MSRHLPRPALAVALLAFAVILTAASQGAKFPTGLYKANNGTNEIALDFDTTGAVNVSVDGQPFSSSTWQAIADTVLFGPVTGAPEGYNCTTNARYLWSFSESRMTFTRLVDDCEVRMQSLTSLAWTKSLMRSRFPAHER